MIYILIVSALGSYYTIPDYYGSFYHDFVANSTSAVSFYWSSGLHISYALDLWISNPVDSTITYIQASSYQVSKASLITIAGSSGVTGYQDGDLSTSLLNTPRSIYVYNNTAYVADTENHCIRVIDLEVKSIHQYAGQCQIEGFKDGPPQYNKLSRPDLVGVVDDLLFINDSGNHYIRVVNMTSGNMTTLLGGACRDIKNITTSYPQPSYDFTSSVFYSKSVNIHTIVCDTNMVLTTGEPSEVFLTAADIQEPCTLHITLCGPRTQPLVARQYG